VGLDYYTHTAFEIQSDDLSTGTVCGGGRYDGLVTELGGPDTPAVAKDFRALNITAATDAISTSPGTRFLRGF